MFRQHDDDLLGTWQQHIAELTLQRLQSEPAAVLHHLQSFPLHVVQRGLETSSIAHCTDIHERIASFLPAPEPPPSTFYTFVMRDAFRFQENIIKTYVASKIADKIHSMAGGRSCQVVLNGCSDPMKTWMHQIQAELEPLKCIDLAWEFHGQVDGIFHRECIQIRTHASWFHPSQRAWWKTAPVY